MKYLNDFLGLEDDGFHVRGLCSFGSSPSGNTNTVQSTTPWSGQSGYLTGNSTSSYAPTGNGNIVNSDGGPGIYGAAQSLYTNYTPQYYPSDTYSPLTTQQQGLMNNLISDTSNGGDSGLTSANSNITSTLDPSYTTQTQGTFNQGTGVLGNELSSSYLNPANSPTYNTAISNALAQALPAASASFTNGNRSDSGLATAAETSATANAAGGLAQAQYQANQGIQNSAAQQSASNLLTQQGNQSKDTLTAPMVEQAQLGNLTTGLNTAGMSQTDLQNQLNANVASYNYGQMLPWNELSMYSSAINGTGMPTSTTTSQPYFSNPTANVLSGISAAGTATAAASALAQAAGYSGLFMGGSALFSDEKLKTNIQKVGETDTGLPLYMFRYKGEPPMSRHLGLMAQDVEKVRPEAIGYMPGGIMMVDYEKALAA